VGVICWYVVESAPPAAGGGRRARGASGTSGEGNAVRDNQLSVVAMATVARPPFGASPSAPLRRPPASPPGLAAPDRWEAGGSDQQDALPARSHASNSQKLFARMGIPA